MVISVEGYELILPDILAWILALHPQLIVLELELLNLLYVLVDYVLQLGILLDQVVASDERPTFHVPLNAERLFDVPAIVREVHRFEN